MEHFATSSPLSLEKVDLFEVDSVTSCKSLDIIPPSATNSKYRLVVGDGSGSLQCISLKKGRVVDINFKAKIPEGKIESITLGESSSGEKRIFVSAGTAVRGLTRRGKEFFRFSTNIIEPLKSMVFASSHLHGIGNTVYNAYDMEGRDVASITIPSGIGAVCSIIPPGPHVNASSRLPFSVILGCNDSFLRVLSSPQSFQDAGQLGVANFPVPPGSDTPKQFLCSLRTPGPVTSLTQWHPTPVILLNTDRLNSQKRIAEIRDRIARDRQTLQARLAGLGLAATPEQQSSTFPVSDLHTDGSSAAALGKKGYPPFRLDTSVGAGAPDTAHASWIHSPSRPGAGEHAVTEDGYIALTYFVFGTAHGHVGLVAFQEKEEFVAPPSRSYKTPSPAPMPPSVTTSVSGQPRYRLQQVWCLRSTHSQAPPKLSAPGTSAETDGMHQPLHATATSTAAVTSLATFDLSGVRSTPGAALTAPATPLDGLRGEILVGRQDGSVEVYSVEHAAYEAFQTEMLGATPVDSAHSLAGLLHTHTPDTPQGARTPTDAVITGTISGLASGPTSARSTHSLSSSGVDVIAKTDRKPLPAPTLLYRGSIGSAIRGVTGAKLQHPERPEMLVLTMDGRITSFTPKLALLEYPDSDEAALLTDERLKEAYALLSSIQTLQALVTEKSDALAKMQESGVMNGTSRPPSTKGAADTAASTQKNAPDRLYPLEVSWNLEPGVVYASQLDQQTALARRRTLSTSAAGVGRLGAAAVPSDPLIPPFPGPSAFTETNVPLFLEGVANLSIETPIDMDHVLLSSELPLDLPDIPDYRALAQKGLFSLGLDGTSGIVDGTEEIPTEIQEKLDRHRLYKANMLKERDIDITYEAARLAQADITATTIPPPAAYTKDTDYTPPAPRALSVVVFPPSSQKKRLQVRFIPVEGFHGDLQLVSLPSSADKPWTLTHTLSLCSLSLHQRVLDTPLTTMREELQKNWILFLQNRGRDEDPYSAVGIPLGPAGARSAANTRPSTGASRSGVDASQVNTPFSSSLRSIASHQTDTEQSVLQSDGTLAPLPAPTTNPSVSATASTSAASFSVVSASATSLESGTAEISVTSGAHALERVRANVMDVLRAVPVIRPLLMDGDASAESPIDGEPLSSSSLYSGRFSDLLLAKQHLSALYQLPAHMLPNRYPFSNLSATGNFTAAQVHDWLRECLPNHSAQIPTGDDGTPYGSTESTAVQYVYTHSILGTVLFVEYWDNHLVVQSDNPTSLMILWTHVTEGSTLAKCDLQVKREVNSFAGTYFLHTIHERLARVILQMAKTSLVSAVRDVVASVEPLSERLTQVKNRFSDLLERCGRMKRIPSIFRTGDEGLTQALHDIRKEHPWVDETLLELFLFGDIYESESALFRDIHTRLCGYIADAFVDFHKLLTGKNVSEKIPELLQFFDEKYLYKAPGDGTKSEMLRAIDYFNNPS